MEEPANLEDILARIAKAEDDDGDHTSTRAVVNALGRRSFAPLLLLPGLVTLLPIGGIPGVPTVMSVLLLLVSVQLLFGRRSFWLPSWLLDRSVSRSKLETSRRWMLRPARFIDFFLRPRLTFLTDGACTFLRDRRGAGAHPVWAGLISARRSGCSFGYLCHNLYPLAGFLYCDRVLEVRFYYHLMYVVQPASAPSSQRRHPTHSERQASAGYGAMDAAWRA